VKSQPHLAQAAHEPQSIGSLRVGLATTPAEIQEAQRLRYEVFAQEMGARLHTTTPGLDQDRFDSYCQHLLVRDVVTEKVVSCTRLLNAQQAQRAGGFYSQTEFDLSRVLANPGRFVEVGRTCVHRDYRNGTTITALWSGLAGLVSEQGIDYFMGCASVPLGDNNREAQAIFADLVHRYLSTEEFRAWPHRPLPRQDMAACVEYQLPPLLKAYLRIGAKICGEPCLDPDFQVADLFIVVSTQRLERRYARHFLRWGE